MLNEHIKPNQRLRFYLLKILPKPLIKLIVRLKGTGIRTIPKQVNPQNTVSLRCTIATNKYGSFCTPDSCRSDTPVQYIYRGEQYEEQTLQYITDLDLPGDIIHAGAYFGDSLPLLSRAVPSEQTVWAFEPNPESYRCAAITLLLNNISNVRLQNTALGNTKGVASLKVADRKTIGGTAHIQAAADTNTVPVAMETLDNLIPADRTISLIHLDIEGYEVEALAGAKKIITKQQPIIVVELNDPRVISHLESIGYRMRTGLEERQWVEGYRNGVFVKQ